MIILFKSLTAAARIVYENPGGAQSRQGKAHGHAVVLIGLDGAGFWHAGIDGDTAVRGFTADPHAAQFRDDGAKAVTFLVADMPNA